MFMCVSGKQRSAHPSINSLCKHTVRLLKTSPKLSCIKRALDLFVFLFFFFIAGVPFGNFNTFCKWFIPYKDGPDSPRRHRDGTSVREDCSGWIAWLSRQRNESMSLPSGSSLVSSPPAQTFEETSEGHSTSTWLWSLKQLDMKWWMATLSVVWWPWHFFQSEWRFILRQGK